MLSRIYSILLLTAFMLFFSLDKTFAALTITGFSTDTINSSEDVLIINASASGLQNSTQYLEVAFTKDGESANYFGLTLNGESEWYQYKSSPSTSDLSSYFFSFTPVNGAWSGQIQARVDINDSGFKGQGKYNVKLLKFITSTSISSNILSVSVNISPTPTNSPTPLPTNTPTPTNIPTPTKTPTLTSKPSSTLTPSTAPTKIPPDSVLGESTKSDANNFEIPKKEDKKDNISKNNNFLPIVFILTGVVFLLACVMVILYPKLKSYLNDKNE